MWSHCTCADCLTLRLVCLKGSSQYVIGRPTGSSRSVPFLSPVGTHSYQQSHCCPTHTNQAVPYLSSAQSVPTVTNSHTAALHTQISAQMLSCTLPTFHLPSLHPLHFAMLLLPFTFTRRTRGPRSGRFQSRTNFCSQLTNTHYVSLRLPSPFNSFSFKICETEHWEIEFKLRLKQECW